MPWTMAGLWLAVVASGVYHGINPGMGWPLAVSAGLMGRSRKDLAVALASLAVGHILAMLVILLPFALVSALLDWQHQIRAGACAMVMTFGIFRLVKRRHPRALARIKPSQLALWSFAIATAHGAGLMLLPIYFGLCSVEYPRWRSSGHVELDGAGFGDGPARISHPCARDGDSGRTDRATRLCLAWTEVPFHELVQPRPGLGGQPNPDRWRRAPCGLSTSCSASASGNSTRRWPNCAKVTGKMETSGPSNCVKGTVRAQPWSIGTFPAKAVARIQGRTAIDFDPSFTKLDERRAGYRGWILISSRSVFHPQQTSEQLQRHLGECLHSSDGEAAWNDRHGRTAVIHRPHSNVRSSPVPKPAAFGSRNLNGRQEA